MLGNILRGREHQYVAHKDDTSKTWRILDTWHEKLTQIGPEDEIEDDNEAVTILTEGAFIALVQEAARLGVLQNSSFGTGEAEYEARLLDRDGEINKLQEQLLRLEEDKSEVIRSTSHSESYELKEKAMESILKMVSISDLTELSKEQTI